MKYIFSLVCSSGMVTNYGYGTQLNCVNCVNEFFDCDEEDVINYIVFLFRNKCDEKDYNEYKTRRRPRNYMCANNEFLMLFEYLQNNVKFNEIKNDRINTPNIQFDISKNDNKININVHVNDDFMLNVSLMYYKPKSITPYKIFNNDVCIQFGK
ncbi:hypothetical protein Catovirus_1_398 [Catovirus CTV1]|uniref:Uncharacterized protein n=1 Tax=Catovirus CTV1 TaxID=1977631 RepID=A0A1V0S9M0_9VIRU|nr:hypothetical protein Catovirus_1_398 [Catovirus CTV1]